MQLMLCKIWGFHGGDSEKCCLLGCYVVWLLWERAIQRHFPPPSSGWQKSPIPFSETSVFTKATLRHIPECGILQWKFYFENSDIWLTKSRLFAELEAWRCDELARAHTHTHTHTHTHVNELPFSMYLDINMSSLQPRLVSLLDKYALSWARDRQICTVEMINESCMVLDASYIHCRTFHDIPYPFWRKWTP
jgi:hypothetical protein